MDKPYIKDYSIIVSLISYEYSKRYRMIDRQDISQELWLWFASRPNKLRDWYDNFESKDRDKLVAKSLRNAALKFCTREKAKVSGYEISDNFYYQPQIIEEFLPYILNDSYMLPIGVNDVNYKPDRNSIAEGNTWLAVRADISEAFKTIEERHQNVLRLRYNSLNVTLEQVGSELNISSDAARKRVDRAIQAMIDELGGKRPYTEYDHANPEE